jgi:hypothetical protein
MTHVPKNPWCEACKRAKMQQKAHKRVGANLGDRPLVFGDQLTADHIVANAAEDQSLGGDRDALVITDRATGFVECYPVKTKSADDAYRAFQEFLGPHCRPGKVHTDNSQELIKALSDLGIVHERALPYRPQSNGVAERAVRRVLEGTRTILMQAGLPPPFWSFACRHFCFSHNTKMWEGDSPWNGRFGKGHFKGPHIPFGCLVDFLPVSPLRSEKPKFGPNAVPGIFLMYVLAPGCVWKGHVMVAALSEFDNVDFAKDDWARDVRTQTVKEVSVPTGGDHRSEYVFPLRKALRKGSQGIAIAFRCRRRHRWRTVLAVAGSGSPSTGRGKRCLVTRRGTAKAGGWDS